MPTMDKAFKWHLLNLGAVCQLSFFNIPTLPSLLCFSQVFIYFKFYTICYNYLLNFLLHISNY